jgi:hypothetical protein
MDIIVVLLLIVGIVLVTISWLKSELNCPPPQIVYRYVPKHTLDVQFSDSENNPSEVFKDMFTKSTPWIGGFDLGSGKTYVVAKEK